MGKWNVLTMFGIPAEPSILLMELLPSMSLGFWEPLQDVSKHSAFSLGLRLRHSVGCLPISVPDLSIRLILFSGDRLGSALQPRYQLRVFGLEDHCVMAALPPDHVFVYPDPFLLGLKSTPQQSSSQQFSSSQAVHCPGPNAHVAPVVAAAPASEQNLEIWNYSMDLTQV